MKCDVMTLSGKNKMLCHLLSICHGTVRHDGSAGRSKDTVTHILLVKG